MVSDGDCRLSPESSLAYDVRDLVEAVVVAHLRVAVQLDPAAVRVSVFLELLFDLLERREHHEVLVLICVVFYGALRPYHVAGVDVFLYLGELFLGGECLHRKCPRPGRYKYRDQLAAAFYRHGIYPENLAFDDRLVLRADKSGKLSVWHGGFAEVGAHEHELSFCVLERRAVLFALSSAPAAAAGSAGSILSVAAVLRHPDSGV